MTQLEITRGDTSTLRATVTNDGEVYNVSGKTLRFTAKRSPLHADADAVIAKSTGAGIVDLGDGVVEITINPADTASLPAKRTVLNFDLQLKSGTEVYTVADGVLVVNPDVTITA